MATVFKRGGKGRWIAAWFNHDKSHRHTRSTGTTDKRLAERLASQWEGKEIERREGLTDARAEALSVQQSRPLSEHLADFLLFLSGKGTGDQSVQTAETRLRRIIRESKAEKIADLTPSRVLSAIQHLRTPGVVTKSGLSNKTASEHVRAIKGFSRWLVRDKRSAIDDLVTLAGFNEETDRRRVRRHVTGEELVRILAVAEQGKVVGAVMSVKNNDGSFRNAKVTLDYPERVWAYRVAAGTGFRASEVASLTPESFDLESNPPTVTVQACHSKRKRMDVQPIRRDLAELLRPFLAGKPKGQPVCPLPDRKAALLVRGDMEKARAAWIAETTSSEDRSERESSDFLRHVDSQGRIVDFHGLRHTFITNLVQSGASVKVAQELARHSSPTLTIGRYAHARRSDLSAALDKLPAETTASALRAGDNATSLPRPSRVEIDRVDAPSASRTSDGEWSQVEAAGSSADANSVSNTGECDRGAQRPRQHARRDEVPEPASECNGSQASGRPSTRHNPLQNAALRDPLPADATPDDEVQPDPQQCAGRVGHPPHEGEVGPDGPRPRLYPPPCPPPGPSPPPTLLLMSRSAAR